MTLKKRKNNFTLLEIFVCVAILGVAAVTIGWQMKNMVASHHFHQNVSNLMTDLRQCQLLALSDRIEIDVTIHRDKEAYSYLLRSDEPDVGFSKRPKKMGGVTSIVLGNRPVENLTISIDSWGRIEQKETIKLYQDEGTGIELDATQPLLIQTKPFRR